MKEVQNPEKFIKDLIPTYTNKVSEVNKLIGKLEKIKKAGLWWDSKVPEKDKVKLKLQSSTLLKWNIVTIPFKNISYSTRLKKSEVTNAVKALRDFYSRSEILTKEIDKIMLDEGINIAEPKINSLIFQLKEDIVKAKKDKEESQSSTVYNLNKELIAVQSQVVSNLQVAIWEASQKRNLTAANQLAQGVDLNQECRGIHDEYERRNRELEGEKQVLQEKNQALEEEKQAWAEKFQEAEKKSQEAEKKNRELKQEFEAFKKEVATTMQNITIAGVKDARGNNQISH